MKRITAEQVRERMRDDPNLLLVCALDDVKRCAEFGISEAISYQDFEGRRSLISPDQEIVLFCDCPHDEAAISRVEELERQGFENVEVLEGGVKAWHQMQSA